MKISEAIRLGSMMKPQAFGSDEAYYFNEQSSCAIGAAAEALGLPLWSIAELERRIKSIVGDKCPSCGKTQPPHEEVIIHLNDDHRWTREQIADWVETLEQSAETPQPAIPVTVAS